MADTKKQTKVIGLCQVKGGAGRSTLATNIAGELSKGASVALIDADMPQGTSSSWAALRQGLGDKAALATYTAPNPRGLIALVHQHTGAYDYIVLDGPPRLAEVARAILALSDLVLVPMGTSLPEIWASADLTPHIADARKLKELNVRLVWTRFRAATKLAQELEGAGAKELGLKPLRTHMALRQAYATALGEGRTGAEMGDIMASLEVRALIAEIQRILR